MPKTQSSLAGRAFFAVLLMVGFYALAFAICAVFAVLMYMDTQGGRIHPKLWLGGLFTIGVVVWSVWPRKSTFPDPGVPLRKKDQPELWKMISEVAEDAEQEPPVHVFLVPEINAFVAERNSRMGFGGERIMGVGLPLLQTLTVPQLRAVIAHEFGHFHGGDTRLGPVIYRTREAIGRTITKLKESEGWLHKPFEWYGKFYLRSTFSISRAQEFAADALSVRLVGLDAAQSALRRVSEVGPLYDIYLENEYFAMLNRNVRPPLAEGFELYLESDSVKEMQLDFVESAMQAKGNPYDTHPPLSQRLAAAAEVDGAGTETGEGPLGITLLREIPKVEEATLLFMTRNKTVTQIPRSSWTDCAEVISKAWKPFVEEHAAKLPSIRAGDLGEQRDKLVAMAKTVNPEVPEQEQLSAGAWFLGILLAQGLERSGFQARTSPGNPIDLVRGACTIEAFNRTHEVATGRFDAEAWKRVCAAEKIEDLVLSGPELAAQGSA